MPSTATTRTVTGLTNGTAYIFRVAAVNGIGTGAFSSASSAVTPTSIIPDPLFSSVSLLLPMDGTDSTFVDASPATKQITAGGNATQSATQSKFGGKSAYFDGSGDYLTLASTSDLSFSTGAFTIECWVYAASYSASQTLYARAAPGNQAAREMAVQITNANTLRFYHGQRGVNDTIREFTAPTTLTENAWHHIALSRDGSGVCRAFFNGVASSTTHTDSANLDNDFPAFVGNFVLGGDFYDPLTGYIDDLRITKGHARYTATFTPPAAAFPTRGIYEDPFFESVSLLLPMDGTGSTFVDSSPIPKTITAVGNATQSTAESKWGGKSLAMDGQNGTYLSVPAAGLSFGTGDFCIEGWWYWPSPSTYQYFMASDTMTGGYFQMALNGMASNAIGIGRTNVDWPLVWSGHNIQANTWTHVAVSRASGVARCYVNGTRIGNEISDSTNFTTGPNALHIGRQESTGAMTGYIDDLRITVGSGSGRGYTGATITVPTAAFPTS
jgi:hypothetical protein